MKNKIVIHTVILTVMACVTAWLVGYGISDYFRSIEEVSTLEKKLLHINEYCKCECKPPPYQ